MLEPPELELQLQSVQRQDVDVAKESEVKHEAFRLRHWKPSPAKAFPSSQQGLAAIAGHQDLQRSFSVQIPGAMQGLVARPLHNSHSNSNSQSWLRHRRGQHGWCGRCCCRWLQLLQLQPETPRRPRSPMWRARLGHKVLPQSCDSSLRKHRKARQCLHKIFILICNKTSCCMT